MDEIINMLEYYGIEIKGHQIQLRKTKTKYDDGII
jgi:hypothetical protein